MDTVRTLLVVILILFWGASTLLIGFKLILKNKELWVLPFTIVSLLILCYVVYILGKQGFIDVDFNLFKGSDNMIPKK